MDYNCISLLSFQPLSRCPISRTPMHLCKASAVSLSPTLLQYQLYIHHGETEHPFINTTIHDFMTNKSHSPPQVCQNSRFLSGHLRWPETPGTIGPITPARDGGRGRKTDYVRGWGRAGVYAHPPRGLHNAGLAGDVGTVESAAWHLHVCIYNYVLGCACMRLYSWGRCEFLD